MKIGLFADSHYCNEEEIGTRRPIKSLEKLKRAIADFNANHVSLVICLGDLINTDIGNDVRNLENVRTVAAVLKTLEAPLYCVLGNHDLEAMGADAFEALGGFRSAPLALTCEGLLLILLDANYRRDGQPYTKGYNDWTDTFIPESQLDWLKNILKNGSGPAYVFIHQNTDDAGRPGDPHLVANAAQVRGIIEESGRVKAVYQGHYHYGYFQEINGIPYITLRAMCEVDNEDESYRIVDL